MQWALAGVAVVAPIASMVRGAGNAPVMRHY